MDELLVGDFSKTFEPGDLHSRLELCNGFFLLFLIVAVDVGFAVLDPEERGLEDVHVSSSYQIRVVLQEEGKYQHPDVHTVIIGISRHHYIVVSEIFQVVFHAKGRDEQVQLFVLRHALAALLVAVDRLSPQGENGLIVGVAGLGNGSARGITLCDEYGGVLYVVLILLGNLVVVVEAAVAELAVVDSGLAVALAGLFLDA